MSGAWVVAAAAILVAGILAIWHPPLGFLDGAYALGFYPAIQQAMTAASNRLPFALGNVLVIAVFLIAIGVWARIFRYETGWPRAGALAIATCALAACLYIWFLVAWGWNYARPSFATSLHAREVRLDRAQLDRLENALAGALDAAAVAAHAAPSSNAYDVATLVAAERHTLAVLAIRHPVTPTTPKHWMFDFYFNAAGVTGMFFPFTFETYLASDLLWFEYPFTLEHEWGHVAGIARESDANFVAAVATLESPDATIKYSGLLMVYAAMPRGPADKHLSPLVLSDYEEMRRRDSRRINPFLSTIAWGTYDRYLRSQHVRAGIVNYSQYVGLLLGTDIGREALSKATGQNLDDRPGG